VTISVPPLRELVDPKHAALLLIDIQAHLTLDSAYIQGVPEALTTLGRLVAEARKAGMTIIHIRVVERPETDSPVWLSRHRTKPHRVGARREGSPGAEFHPDFQPQPGEPVLVKSRYSAFFRTNLDALLRERGITSVLLTGIASNVCVEATAVDAFQLEYWTLVVADCTAARTPEEQHRAIKDVQNNWGIVVNATDVIETWQRSQVVAAPS
jgi:ureidoacrylate peracid hydrolase